jgi:hypothetical protein
MDLDQEAGRQALKATAMWNFVDVLKVLLEAGMSPDFFHGSMTPLMWATVQGNDKVMRVLLDAKADVHLHVRPDGRKVQTACMHAVVDQDVGALKLLLDARVSVNVPQCMGDNQTGLLLHTAAASAASLDSFAQPAIVRALLRAKADVHGAAGPNAAGPAIVRSPIFAAVTTGSSAAVVRLLLRAGADLYPCLLDKATTHGSKDVARALIAHKAQSAVLELVQKPARQ